ncbi:MAPK regulated corepressor interacting protein 2 isoform X2 [Sus scrofa]|uniref:MAPK regulated corepressor interacting protein 2 isoform X2 n=1 Tax=Sus scrofa TaxID=9823 RepID=UPI000A2B000F|nr:MAPK regulated corepressor interacting protein 2 isoform X2 [Sus scrofa]
MLRCSASRGPALDLRWPSARHPRHPGGIALDWTLCDLTHTFHTHGAQSLGREQLDTAKGSHAAAGGEPARRAPEMPASRAPDPAAPTDAASRTLAPVKCPSQPRRNPERRWVPEPRMTSRPAGPRVPGGGARAAQDSRLPPPAVVQGRGSCSIG